MKKAHIQKNITYKHKQTYKENNSPSLTRKQHLPMNMCKDNFYRCVNGQWLNHVKMPPYLSAFGISEEVEKRVETQLFSLVRTCKEPTICALATSAIRRQNSIETVKDLLNKINSIRDINDVSATLGLLCKYKIGNLFSLEGRYYFGNGGQFTLHIDRGSIGLPNRKYYEQRTPFSHYKHFLDKIGAFFSIKHLSSIVNIEHDIAPYILAMQKNEKELYVDTSEIAHKYKDIPWSALFSAYGFNEKHVVISSHEWLHIVNGMFKRLTIDMWKLVFSSEVILHFIPYLPSPLDTYYFEFYRKELRGQMTKLPLRYTVLEILTMWATPFMSKAYVKRFLTPSFKALALSFAEEIRDSACKRMETVEWLQPSTRDKAAKKIKAMRLSIAYPDEFADLKAPALSKNNLIDNLIAMGEWRSEYEINRLGEHRDDQKDWDDPVYAVNGYYYSEANELVIPSGSLLEPFFSESRPLGWNYGGVGAIIGHEMTHAFDEEGCEYDEKNQKKKWWSPTDTRNYEKITRHLVKMFNEHSLMHKHIDGKLTLSENIADLGGLAIALDALNVRLQGEDVNTKIKAYKQFFTAYAVSWRIKERTKKQLQGLFMDKHAPTPLRVNLVVNQFQEWYDAFNVSSGLMFLPLDKRTRIF